MLYLLADLRELWGGFNVFGYITFRAAAAAVTGLVVTWLLARAVIPWLKRSQFQQTIRNDGPQTHLAKQGTPTMGGIMILGATFGAAVLWARLDNRFVHYVLAILIGYGLLGLVDDWIKVRRRDSGGVRPRTKLWVQFAISGVVAAVVMFDPAYSTEFYVPFWKTPLFNLGLLYIPFATLVIVGTSNAVNLTDGLDGLATGVALATLLTYGIIAYAGGHIRFAEYLQIPYSPQLGEVAVVIAALIGAGMGFLWYNAYPAEVFMGDVGSLALGGVIGTVAVLVKQEILLVLVGGIFVAEAVSVMIQVGVYKRTKRRVFKMAPLHHHFELSGWPETKVVVRFWIVAILLAIVGLASLKLR